MVGIVFDKLMQYQIVDPTDVVGWTFLNGSTIGQPSELAAPLSLSAFEWDLMRGALDKANGRVMIARRKVTALRKEDDDTRARAKASANDNSMEVDADRPGENFPISRFFLENSKQTIVNRRDACRGQSRPYHCSQGIHKSDSRTESCIVAHFGRIRFKSCSLSHRFKP